MLFTVFDPATRRVTHHRMADDHQVVLMMLHAGEAALLGRHVPFDELVPEVSTDFVITNPAAEPQWVPPIVAATTGSDDPIRNQLA